MNIAIEGYAIGKREVSFEHIDVELYFMGDKYNYHGDYFRGKIRVLLREHGTKLQEFEYPFSASIGTAFDTNNLLQQINTNICNNNAKVEELKRSNERLSAILKTLALGGKEDVKG